MEETPAIEPSEFDLVVVGTGLTESIVAAAAAKAGHSVLQLDPSARYGGSWASLQLDELSDLLLPRASGAQHADAAAVDGARSEQQQGQSTAPDSAAAASASAAGVRGGEVWRRPGADLGPSRQYSLDLAPKVAYGAGPLIELLLGSGAHNYLEFKLVQGSYLLDTPAAHGGEPALRSVPSSRSEVFKDRQLSPVQKRSLMRFLKAAAEALDGEGPLKDAFGAQPIQQLLQQQGLDAQLQQSLLHGVLLADDQECDGSAGGSGSGEDCGAGAGGVASGVGGSGGAREARLTAAAALERLRVFVQSAGRYGAGTGPFLTLLYGCGELPQAFARAAAVAGAVQVLRCGVAGLSFDEHTFGCDGVELESGQVIRCQRLAADAETLREWVDTFRPASNTCSTHRCCAVLDGPLVPGEHHTLVTVLPPATASRTGGGSSRVVRALALSSSTAVCPPGKNLLYLWADAGEAGNAGGAAGAAAVLLPALAALARTDGLQAQHGGSDNGGSAESGAAAAGESLPDSLTGNEPGASSSDRSAGGKPAVLWAALFTQDSRQLSPPGARADGSGRWPANVALCSGPDSSVTFASAVQAAKQCYWQLFPAPPNASAAAAAHGTPAAAAAAAVGSAAFPLDPRPHSGQAEEGEDASQGGGAAGAAGAAGADVDSDDEAVAALQAALKRVATNPDGPVSSGGEEYESSSAERQV